ncbi:hypothetical protein G9A89_004088 [Geosiphon pyriformis]|nr:hypothetical protein G9A89_004088 [Geosiphon pyriformis]
MFNKYQAKTILYSLQVQRLQKKLSSMGAWIASNKDYWMRTHYYCKPCHCKCYDYSKRQGKWDNKLCLACSKQLLDEGIWNDIPGQKRICDTLCQYTILISDWVSCDMPITAVWHHMANTKVEGTMSSKILKIKNNPLEPVNIVLIPNSDAFLDLETGPEEFHEHYQNLALTREEQEQHLCDLIYNSLLCIIYTIPKEEEPISSCVSKLESKFNSDSNSNNNNNENNSSSSAQYGHNNDNNLNSDLNSNLNYKQYIALLDLTKKQKLR